MSFSYDETDDFEDEPQDPSLDEVDSEEDLEAGGEAPATALSQAFLKAQAAGAEDEDESGEAEEEEVEVEAEENTQEAVEAAVEKTDTEPSAEVLISELLDGPETIEPDEQGLETLDPLPDDDEDVDEDDEDWETDIPPPVLPSLEIESFRPQEQSNYAYADAVTAYYEEKDYQRAIEKFDEAIKNEERTAENGTDSEGIVAKAIYWQAEAYVKMEDIPKAIKAFEKVVQDYQGHYLSLAAQRRAAQLNAEDS